MAAHDYGLFIRRAMQPITVARYHAMAVEELSFACEIDTKTLAWLNYHESFLDTFLVNERRAAHSNLEPNPVARHKIATQQARLKQIRDRRQK